MENDNARSVSEVVNAIKVSLEYEYSDLTIVGEITNLSSSAAGHYYFTLSDSNASLSAALFRMDANRNPVIKKLKDGDKVIVRGPLSVYPKRGSFQILAKRILPYGKGDLKAQFEMLKRRLSEEGLFDQELKKEIPKIPGRVAVVTAKGGAALQDFLNIMRRRMLWHDIVIVPCTAQGNECAPSVIRALKKIETLDDIDTVVITRGGGSIEDLWGFNDENLIRTVYDFNIPVISAIGHQVDYTLLDFVADLRCETPSAAAEILSQEHTALKSRLDYSAKDIKNLFFQFQSKLMKNIEELNPKNLLHLLKERFYQANTRLKEANPVEKLGLLKLNESMMAADEYASALSDRMTKTLNENVHKTELAGRVLEGMNPKKVLGRGYTIIQTKSGKLLTSKKEFDSINNNEKLEIEFSDGIGSVSKN